MKITTTPVSPHVAALAREAERKKLGWCIPESHPQARETTPPVERCSPDPAPVARPGRSSWWTRAGRKSTKALAVAGRALIRTSKRPVNWLIALGALATGGDYAISAVRAALSLVAG
ncbi:hypothetical protein [Streptomyces sp. NRRL F-2890]|uniref:hypothetical protein n=1 Tax=Streptomyces sp. NRRL F-2890 TaxID=1463845 RepID=UPI00131A5032|nr:hypothetical protein [Streptomyces sp. NRRL F-2890]